MEWRDWRIDEKQTSDLFKIGEKQISAYFSFIFGLFKHTIHFLQQINAKNVHSVYGTGIWTPDLSNMSRQP